VFDVTMILSVVLALAMASSFVRKVTGDATSEGLRERLQVAPDLWRVVAVLELVAASGLLFGLARAPLGAAAALGIALIMLGAIAAHLRAHIGGLALFPPLLVLVFSTATAALRVATA
jgi:uncharacterized membrane protein YphA (DoxX/SURF4 family)